MVALIQSDVVQVDRSGELVAVVIAGQYFRAVHVWDLWQVEADLRRRPDISAVYRNDVTREIRRIRREFWRHVRDDCERVGEIEAKTLSDHVCEALLYLVITGGIFGIVWFVKWVW